MPVTGSQMPTTESTMDAVGIEKQVTHYASSFIGSQVSGASRHPSTSKNRLLLAELKERQLREKVILEQKELANKQQRLLMEARHEVELARLEEYSVDVSCNSSERSVKIDKMT